MTSSTTFLQEKHLTNEETKSLYIFFTRETNKSDVYDGINFNVVKNNFCSLLKPQMQVFNLFLKDGIFPEILKIARLP